MSKKENKPGDVDHGTPTTRQGAPAAPPAPVVNVPPLVTTMDSYAHLDGVEAATVAGKSYATQATIRDTDKRAGKPRSILNIPAARA